MVSWISDDDINDFQKLDSLKDSVKEALSDVINLTSKLTNTKKKST
jgi:ATP-dependent Lon protease